MKLVELLAEKIKEWPEGAKNITQDHDGSVSPCTDPHNDLEFDGSRWSSTNGFHMGLDIIEKQDLSSDYKTAIVTRAQWQAERDKQKGGEWKRHRGGAKPASVSDGDMVEARLRCGDTQTACAGKFLWNHADCDHSVNITKYRVISQPQSEEVEVKDTTIGTLSYKVEIDTSAETQAIDELAAKWDQIETPFKWRDEVTELNAYIEKYTRERDALIERLASEGFALIPPVVSVVSGFSGADMNDWRNWVAGDEVECVSVPDKHAGYFTVCESYSINSVDQEDEGTSTEIDVFCDSSFSLWCPASSFRFIRRP